VAGPGGAHRQAGGGGAAAAPARYDSTGRTDLVKELGATMGAVTTPLRQVVTVKG
jgi:hypothetical protein